MLVLELGKKDDLVTTYFFFFFEKDFHLFIYFLFVVNFVIHWNETAMGLHVFPSPPI